MLLVVKMSSQDQQEETDTLAYCVALDQSTSTGGEPLQERPSESFSIFISDLAVIVGLGKFLSESSSSGFLLIFPWRREDFSESTSFSLNISLFSSSDPADLG